eukprot:TRINITY_DN1783_c0_g1_i1.p1 TRINITY_DN1783_c0_g1~~TRINITY_DN1783_c0_g1_i1.p1  ORF type:complete len:963 (-),score=170.19 TRINITY_DN1783_c0_g1_i1:25-2913(-)
MNKVASPNLNSGLISPRQTLGAGGTVERKRTLKRDHHKTLDKQRPGSHLGTAVPLNTSYPRSSSATVTSRDDSHQLPAPLRKASENLHALSEPFYHPKLSSSLNTGTPAARQASSVAIKKSASRIRDGEVQYNRPSSSNSSPSSSSPTTSSSPLLSPTTPPASPTSEAPSASSTTTTSATSTAENNHNAIPSNTSPSNSGIYPNHNNNTTQQQPLTNSTSTNATTAMDGTQQSQPKVRVVVSMKTFWARLASFVNGERLWVKTQPSAQSLALAGFFFSPNERHPDRATCHACALSFTNWRPSDEPWALHSKYNKRCNKRCPFVESKPARLPLPSYVKQMDLVGIAEELEAMEVEALSASKGASSVTPMQIKSKLDYFVRINAKIFNARPDLKKHTDELAGFLETQAQNPQTTNGTNMQAQPAQPTLVPNRIVRSRTDPDLVRDETAAKGSPNGTLCHSAEDHKSGVRKTSKKTKELSKSSKNSPGASSVGSKSESDLTNGNSAATKKALKKEKLRLKKEKKEKLRKEREEQKKAKGEHKKTTKKTTKDSTKKSNSGKSSAQAATMSEENEDIKGVIGEYVVDVSSGEADAKKMEEIMKQDYETSANSSFGSALGNYIASTDTSSVDGSFGSMNSASSLGSMAGVLNSSTDDQSDETSSSSSDSDSDAEDPSEIVSSGGGGPRKSGVGEKEGSYKEIEFSELILEDKIGFGTFCTVWKGLWRGGPVAVKILKEVDLFHRKVTLEFRREAHTMAHIGNHPNVVKFVGVSCSEGQLCIVSEYCQYGSLQSLLRGAKAVDLPPKTIASIARDAAAGILHLHCEGVIHRDIAARNVMIGPNYTAQVGDFGFSRIIEKDASHGVTGTIGPIKHMAPEAILERVYSEKSDVFAFGCLLWEMVARREPYDDIKSLLDVGLKVIRGMRLPIPKDCPPVFAEVMRNSWDTDPEKRPAMSTIFLTLRNYHASL